MLRREPFAPRHLFDGIWRDSADGATFERYSPAHATLVTRAAKGGTADTAAAIAAARQAFDDGRWSRLSGKERAAQQADQTRADARHDNDNRMHAPALHGNENEGE